MLQSVASEGMQLMTMERICRHFDVVGGHIAMINSTQAMISSSRTSF